MKDGRMYILSKCTAGIKQTRLKKMAKETAEDTKQLSYAAPLTDVNLAFETIAMHSGKTYILHLLRYGQLLSPPHVNVFYFNFMTMTLRT